MAINLTNPATPALREYAELLHANGFTIYEPTGPERNFFGYSRVVDGRECFGFVQENDIRLTGYSHSMPLKPSKENGASMYVDSVPDGWENLTLGAAETVASPTNWNSIVGTQDNHESESSLRGYTKHSAE